jgi:hypothetical protein
MALRRASCQPSKTLDKFYQELDGLPSDNCYSSVGHEMLRLLPALGHALEHVDVWGLTSHERLCLLARDDYTSPWFVIVRAVPPDGFQIRYLMPEKETPWPDAYVEGTAPTVAQACDFVVTAIKRSGGWAL